MSVIVRKWCRRCRRHTQQFRLKVSEDVGTVTTRLECATWGRKVTTIEKRTEK